MQCHNIQACEYTLSRYLYAKDECEIMLVSSILTGKLDEAYYWTSEIYYSGYNICGLFWKIYYDFYFEFNPKFEIFIRKKLKNKISIETYFHILQNMTVCKHSSRVFIMRQSIQSFIRTKYPANKYGIRGRKPKYCSFIDKKYQTLIIYIYKKDYQGIAYWLYKLLIIEKCNQRDLFINLLRFLIQDLKKDFVENANDAYFEQLNCVYSKFLNVNKNKNLPDYLLFISVIINIGSCKSSCKSSKEHSINLFDKSNCNSIYGHENICVDRIYNTLKIKRLYSINHHIGSFDIMRNNIDDFKNKILGNWEYYARHTPCWIERFHLFKASFSECCNIIFENDDVLENFYDSYGYELGEQSKSIQNQSIETIRNITWKVWYDLHFKEEVCIGLDDDFKFIY